MARSDSAKAGAATAEAPAAPQPVTSTPVATVPVERFTPDASQETWLKLEDERRLNAERAPNAFVRAAEQNIVFINAPGLNDQWIGKRPEEELYQGQPVSTFRIVPLNTAEALRPGRKVIFPSGESMILPVGITSPDQIVHPETGEKLLAD